MEEYKQAQNGLNLIKTSIVQLIRNNGTNRLGNVDIAKALGLETSDINGKSVNYLTFAILGELKKEKVISQDENKKYFAL